MINVNYKNRKRNLNIINSSKVESNKFFPVFDINGEEYIFKPLSKTKPLTTPLFAYAEVFWSNIISKIVEAPIYKFAKCNGYEDAVQKHYEYGTIVKSILNDDENLINFYDYFLKNPDRAVNIKDYTNYCMMFYDYRPFFNTKLVKNNKDIAEKLAMYILLSVLKGDENFHYENVQLIEKNGTLKIAPMLDHEFSIMFLFHDCLQYNIHYFEEFLQSIKNGIIHDNLKEIKILFPNVISEFKCFIEKINYFPLTDNTDFLFPSNSFFYLVGEERYKKYNEEEAKKLEKKYILDDLDIELVNRIIEVEVKRTIEVILEII